MTRTILEALPIEIVDVVQCHLSLSDLSEMGCVNKSWRHLAMTRLYTMPSITSVKQLNLFPNTNESVQQFLTHLDLSSIGEGVTDIHLTKFMHSRHLTTLNLSNCINVSPQMIDGILRATHETLVNVTLANCRLSSEVLKILGQATSHALERLDLSNTLIRPCMTIDAPNHLEAMTQAASFTHLVDLNLSHCRWVDSKTLQNLEHLQRLESLRLQWCQQLDFNAIECLIRALHDLQTVDLRHIATIDSSDAAIPLFESGPRLMVIMITNRLQTSYLRRSMILKQ